jgi:hypothetical protein
MAQRRPLVGSGVQKPQRKVTPYIFPAKGKLKKLTILK